MLAALGVIAYAILAFDVVTEGNVAVWTREGIAVYCRWSVCRRARRGREGVLLWVSNEALVWHTKFIHDKIPLLAGGVLSLISFIPGLRKRPWITVRCVNSNFLIRLHVRPFHRDYLALRRYASRQARGKTAVGVSSGTVVVFMFTNAVGHYVPASTVWYQVIALGVRDNMVHGFPRRRAWFVRLLIMFYCGIRNE